MSVVRERNDPRRDDVGFIVLSEIRSFNELSERSQTKLADACKGRASLIPEISETVARSFLSFNDQDVETLRKMRREVWDTIPEGELSCDLKFFDQPIRRSTRGLMEDICDHKPRYWTWTEYVAAGGPRSFHVLAEMCEEIFKETKVIEEKRRFGSRISTFRDRCRVSGMHLDLPVVVDETIVGKHKANRRSDRMTPTARIERMRQRAADHPDDLVPWQYQGILEKEFKIRLNMASVAGSWESTRAAWRAFAKMYTIKDPMMEHVVNARSISLFSGIFDSEGSMMKYLQHVKKATIVFGVPWIDERDERSIKAGAKKGAIQRKRSFILKDDATTIVRDLVILGRLDLARIAAVSYTYQLRVQNEGIPLESHELQPNDEEDPNVEWHSHVRVREGSTTIVLRTRKNTRARSAIKRECTCEITPILCGKCALDAQIRKSRSEGSRKVFPNVVSADIKIIQEIATKRDLPRPTWHGFRRGRTTDLAKRMARGEPISPEDIYRSGGWAFGSSALIQYLRREGVDAERAIGAIADLSESD